MGSVKGSAFLASVLIVAVFGMVFAFAWANIPSAPPCNPETHTRSQDLRMRMDELGFHRWQMACAFAVAKDGRSFPQAEKQFSIVWPKESEL